MIQAHAGPARLDDHVGSVPRLLGMPAVIGQVELFDDASVLAIFTALDFDVDFRGEDPDPMRVVEVSADAGHAVTVSRRSSRSRFVSKPVTRNSYPGEMLASLNSTRRGSAT